MAGVVLSNEKALVGKDLGKAFVTFRERRVVLPASPTDVAKFKRKEPITSMAKSILKHRIQTLTGRNMADIEQELGYSIKDGKNMEVDEMRRLAHILILESEGHQVAVVEEPEPLPALSSLGRKRPRLDDHADEPFAVDNGLPQKKGRAARRSMIVKSVHDEVEAMANVANTKRARRSLAPQVMSKPAETSVLGTRGLMEVDNPTPQMIEMMKRKSSTRAAPVPKGMAPVVEKKVPIAPMVEKKVPVIEDGFPGIFFKDEDGNVKNCKIFVALADPTKISFRSIRESVSEFTGANLSVVHTLAEWDPAQIFSLVQTIRNVNKAAGLDSFTVLVGCGLTNVHMFREALLRQTKHVQFVVMEREDQNMDQLNDGKLRETVSLFLLAYFFPNCDLEGNKLPEPMVRPGITTCFRTKNIEDLENRIVDALTEQGDWILDLCCRDRELTLAAQKTGRFALAVESNCEKLTALMMKATAIAKSHDKNFNQGRILQLH